MCFQRSDTVCQDLKALPGAELKYFAAVAKLLMFLSAFTHVFLRFSRFSHMERLCTALTCWMTPAVWLCSWWASCCSPLFWSWRWPLTVAWPDTSSWACASFPTAVPSTRTSPPPVAGALGQEAAVARKVPLRGRGRVVFGFKKGFWIFQWKLPLFCFVLISY